MLAKESVEEVHVRDSNVPRYLCRGHAQAEEPGRQGNRTWRRLNGGHRAGPGACARSAGELLPPQHAEVRRWHDTEKRHGEFRVDERDA